MLTLWCESSVCFNSFFVVRNERVSGRSRFSSSRLFLVMPYSQLVAILELMHLFSLAAGADTCLILAYADREITGASFITVTLQLQMIKLLAMVICGKV